MEHLPPVGWADVATKRDLDHLEASLRGEMANSELRLRGELTSTELRLRDEITGQISDSVSGVRAELREGLRDQRSLMFALFGANTAVVAVAMAILGLA